ncbi:helix-turn-helix transcriptional regulator [Paenarthrobacter sp. PH39-S1]|uniref:helix-turn-helix domain-containing protein n=1 Tax=Paenarthrobacter sp. PH39-S1 TaxID=3046204 RepID=UPI0024B8A783|nr:helix-turn-helix transcriptional regulator [Paenarthrobacter sp. PH39-S1]MDJ0355056.1 helix-turn-helix transcriptional regulator [Paenarthrobacter sp. PH39-S1]
MTELKFRNLNVTPDSPVEDWGFEGLLTAAELGDITHWRRIMAAVRRNPYCEVAREMVQVIEAIEDPGTAGMLRAGMKLVRERAAAEEVSEVAGRLSDFLAKAGMSRFEFARNLGTSQSRLSTYLSGKTVPSAAIYIRAEHLAQRFAVENR